MPKGYKTCSKCGESNGLRSKTCKKCQAPFTFKINTIGAQTQRTQTNVSNTCALGCDTSADSTSVKEPVAGVGDKPGTLNDGTPAVVVTPAREWICPIKPWADDFDSINEWIKMVFRWTKDNKLEYSENGVLYLVTRWWGINSPSYNRVRGIVVGILQSLPQEKF